MAATPLKQRVPIDMGLLEILSQRFEQLAADPVVLVNGNVWYNTTTHRLKRVENGVVVPFFSAADAVKLAAYEAAITEAQADADAANAEIALITNDNILHKSEKAVIKSQYDLLIAEQLGIDQVATDYGIIDEKTNYDNAMTALTNYLNSLNPLYTDYTQDTEIDGALFRQLFGNVYITRQLLANAMSDYAHDTLEQALSVADAALVAANNAQADATAALSGIGAVADDSLFARQEKPAVVQQYNVILAEYAGIDDQADEYGITTERTNYSDAIDALTTYLTGLVPAYNDYTQDTEIVRADFNAAFELYFDTRQLLFNKIYETAKLLADDAAIIARSKGRHFVSEPTTPYEVGDLYSNAVDLYRCIVERLVGAYNAADWEVATHYDRTKTIIDGGLITTGRVEVGGGSLGDGNAGMNGAVSLTPNTDIRFWAGATYANRNTAPWRVQNDGTFYAIVGNIGGWTVDSDSLHSGTKVPGNGYAVNAGDMTIKSDGSLHSKNFYINADGTIGIKGIASFESAPSVYGGQTLSMGIAGVDIWENNSNGDYGPVHINRIGYQGGTTKYRDTYIGDGKTGYVARFFGLAKTVEINAKTSIYGGVDIDTTTDGLRLPRLTTTQMNAISSPPEGLIIYNVTIPAFCGYTAGAWWRFGLV